MKLRISLLTALILLTLVSSNRTFAEGTSKPETLASISTPDFPTNSLPAFNSGEASIEAFVRLPPHAIAAPKSSLPFTRFGFDWHTGLGGAGFDLATPLARKFNLRIGSDFFGYSTTFQQQGANVAINLRMRSAHTSLDWFPFGGRFRISPQMIFANSNHVEATALIPSGSAVTLNGHDYVSSFTDPLHGSGSVDFRKTSPGLTLGFGNIVPRTRSHLSIPVEMGFYFVGQPSLKVNFTGSACDPTQPPAIGCQSVDQDAGFQHNLSAFISRNNHNLSYISLFPIFSLGLGYVF